MAQDLFIENTSHFRSLDLEPHTGTWLMTHSVLQQSSGGGGCKHLQPR